MSDARDRFQQVVGTAKSAVDAAVVTAATVQGAFGPLPDQPILTETPEHSPHLQVDLASEALGRHVEMFAAHAERHLKDGAEELARVTAGKDPWSENPTLVVDPAETTMATLGVEAADPSPVESEASELDAEAAEAIVDSHDGAPDEGAVEAVAGADDAGESSEATEAGADVDVEATDGVDMDAADPDVEGTDAGESGVDGGFAG
jgi:hypothetical protein